MLRKTLILFFCGFVALAFSSAATACRYTVRDVAFVDLGDRAYQLFLFTKGTKGSALSAAFEDVATKVFADANVLAQHVDLDEAPDHPATEYAKDVTAFPALVLTGPDERALELDWSISEKSTPEDLAQLLEAIVDSPARQEVFSKVCDVHSIILVIDGSDEQVNLTTLKMAEEAIPQVEQALEFMPKLIKHPPHLIHLSQKDVDREKVLLWSLGIDTGSNRPSQIALLFGRGRKLGPALRFPEDPRRTFINSLAVVGQDCECGLDRRWMQGQMVPHKWSAQDEALATGKLNFDPGNPLVKAEIDRIVTRGPGAEPTDRGQIEQLDKIFPALSYQEIELDDGRPAKEPPREQAVLEEPAEQAPEKTDLPALEKEEISVALAASPTPATVREDHVDAEADLPAGRWAWMLLAGCAALVLAVGCLILLRKREV